MTSGFWRRGRRRPAAAMERPAGLATLVAAVLLVASVAPAWGAKPSAASPAFSAVASSQSVDEQPLSFSPTSTPMADPAAAPSPSSSLGGARMALALGIVIVLILGLKWTGQRLLQRGGICKPGAVVRVLGRTPLAPKQQVLLLQVGKRVLVVADSHGHMNSLCTIDDPVEVAKLVGTVGEAGEAPERGRFRSVLRRAAEPFGDEAPAASDDDEPATDPDRRSDPQVNGLIDRLREMQLRFKGDQV